MRMREELVARAMWVSRREEEEGERKRESMISSL
jgi:hypothetical protein